jgi:hypothetical protein
VIARTRNYGIAGRRAVRTGGKNVNGVKRRGKYMPCVLLKNKKKKRKKKKM